jgi:hypothetical protein
VGRIVASPMGEKLEVGSTAARFPAVSNPKDKNAVDNKLITWGINAAGNSVWEQSSCEWQTSVWKYEKHCGIAQSENGGGGRLETMFSQKWHKGQ